LGGMGNKKAKFIKQKRVEIPNLKSGKDEAPMNLRSRPKHWTAVPHKIGTKKSPEKNRTRIGEGKDSYR